MSKRAIDESPGINSEADARMSRTLANCREHQAMEFRQMHLALEIQNIELKLQFEEISAINLRLEKANEKFSELSQASPTCYLSVARDGTISLTNRAAEKLLGMSSNRLIGVRFGIFVAEHHRQRFCNFLDQVFNTDTEHSCEIELDTTQTTNKPTTLQLTATRSTTCEQCNLFAIDITIFRQSEIKERRDRERMQFAVCAANIGVWDWDLKTNQVIFSSQWKSQIGYEEHEIGNEFWEWESRVHPDDLALTLSKVQAYLKAPTLFHESEFRFQHKDGSYRYIIARGSLIFDDQGNPLRMLGAHLDHTDRCNVEKRLQMMERAIQATTQGILITDATRPDCPINYVNPAFESMTGYSVAEAIGRNCRFLQGQETDPRSIANIRDCLQRKQSCKVELLNYRKDGVPFWNELSITPVLDEMGKLIHFIGIQTDVTQRRVLDEQLRQAQKMEAIGLLAGGIAHDFNNLLTIIDGYAYLLKCNSIESDSSKDFLDEIRSASRRANDLTRQLLAFGRRQLQSMEVLDFNQVISETVKMLKPLIGESVQVDLQLDPCVDRMWADRGQISQILMNLTLNAKEAMLSGGTISIRTERFSRSVSSDSVSPKLSSENYVMLSVSDTGCGIPDSIQKSVFNPFFTTKPLGTGLGLSVVHGIVEQNGGTVEIASAHGLGTTFRVCLPLIQELTEQTQLESQSETTLCGNELILLVEDDAALRRVASIALSEYGYTVLMAASGLEALSVFGRNLHSIDLMVTDVVMPIMDGVELAEILAKKKPDLGVLFMSGYIAEEESRIQMQKRQGQFLQKPFSPIDLVRSVRRILDS